MKNNIVNIAGVIINLNNISTLLISYVKGGIEIKCNIKGKPSVIGLYKHRMLKHYFNDDIANKYLNIIESNKDKPFNTWDYEDSKFINDYDIKLRDLIKVDINKINF